MVDDVLFLKFWSSYPKKVDKQGAAKSFAKLKVDESLLGFMLSSIEREKNSAQWQSDSQYIPNPATWLNQKRWESQIESVGISSGGLISSDGYGRE